MKRKLKQISIFGVAAILGLLLSGSMLQAEGFSAKGGAAFTTETLPLHGLAFSANYQTTPWPILGGLFTDTEVVYHNLQGSGEFKDSEGRSANVTVHFKSYELDWYLLLGKEKGFFWGPGIGYGLAETQEDVNPNESAVVGDPTPFFNHSNIHYGTLILKIGHRWDQAICEGRLSSFGGLIGGSMLCGITF